MFENNDGAGDAPSGTPRTLTPSPTPVQFNRTCNECGHSEPGKKKIIVDAKFNAETGKIETCPEEVYCMPLCIPEKLHAFVLERQDAVCRKLEDKNETLERQCKRQRTELESLKHELERLTESALKDAKKCIQIFDKCNDKMKRQNTKLKGSACEQCADTISTVRRLNCIRHEKVGPLDGHYSGIEHGKSHPMEISEDETVKFCVVCRGFDCFVNKVPSHDPIMMPFVSPTDRRQGDADLSKSFAQQPMAVQTGGSYQSD
jgi:hypothetical protein